MNKKQKTLLKYGSITVLILMLLGNSYCTNRKNNKLEIENLELKSNFSKKELNLSIDSVQVSLDSIDKKIKYIDNAKNNFINSSVDSLEQYLLSIEN